MRLFLGCDLHEERPSCSDIAARGGLGNETRRRGVARRMFSSYSWRRISRSKTVRGKLDAAARYLEKPSGRANSSAKVNDRRLGVSLSFSIPRETNRWPLGAEWPSSVIVAFN